MSYLLALETSTQICSVALSCGDTCISRVSHEARMHAQRMLPMIEDVLSEAGITRRHLDAIALAIGPGSFTGVRIACSIAQGLAVALECPVIPVSTLQALAQGAYRECGAREMVSVLDARMQEVYVGRYRVDEEGSSVLMDADRLSKPDKVVIPEKVTHVVGSGASLLPSCDWVTLMSDRDPDALDVLTIALKRFELGDVVDVATLEPVYCRREVAHVKTS